MHTLYSRAFPWVFLGYAPLLGEIFQLQPKACYAYDHEPSCNTQLLKDPLLWRVSLTEDSSFSEAVTFGTYRGPEHSWGRCAPVPIRRPSSGFDCRLALIQGPGLSRMPSSGALGPRGRSPGLESPSFSVGSLELFLKIIKMQI